MDRAGKLAPGQASTALKEWGEMAIRRHSAVRLLPRIWDLGASLTAYDATYVALSDHAITTLADLDVRGPHDANHEESQHHPQPALREASLPR